MDGYIDRLWWIGVWLGLRDGEFDFDGGGRNWCGHHEDNQKHQHDIDERGDVNLRVLLDMKFRAAAT